MTNRMRIHKAITVHTAKEDFYLKAEDLGEKAAHIFTGEKGKSQLNNLLNVANSSSKVTDTIDYIKRQIGHDNSGFEKDGFGNDLIDFVYDKLKTVRDSIASELASLDLDEYELQQIHLLLSRQFVNSLVIHYNYAQQEGKDARTAKS